MRRAIQLAAKLYPGPWRSRYSEEFEALLEDHNPGWREFSDVLRGALQMQLMNAATYWKLAGGLALAGAAAAAAVSFCIPRIYESTAVIVIAPQQIPESGNHKEAFRELAASQLNQMEQGTLSRTSLERIITQPGFDLYPEERSQEPMEDTVIRMRTRDIQIRALDKSPAAFTVSFLYPDRQKAQAVVRALTSQFIQQNAEVNRDQATLWRTFWPQIAPPPGPHLEVVDPPNSPQKPINASLLQFAESGLALGLALGLLLATAIHWPKRTLQLAGFALGVCGLAFAISYLLPKTYTSTARMLLTPPQVPVNPTGEAARAPLSGRLQRWEEEALSDAALQEIVAACRLDAAVNMRRHLVIRPVAQSTFEISFSYSDPEKAQAVVREVVTRFTEQNVADQQELALESGDAKAIEITEHKVGEQLEVLDPPSDPVEPTFPDRMKITFAGFALGIALGAITLYRGRHRVLTPQPA